jgi:hypothetical protein
MLRPINCKEKDGFVVKTYINTALDIAENAIICVFIRLTNIFACFQIGVFKQAVLK